MFKRLFTAAVLFGTAATAPPLSAQTVTCAPRDTVVSRLTSGFGEQLIAGGLQNRQSVIELWASPETGTFTVILSRADGLSCVLSSGTNFHQNPPIVVNNDTAS